MNDIQQGNQAGAQAPNVLAIGPVTIFVCLLCGIVGGFFGDVAAWFYEREGPQADWIDLAGIALGAVAGLLAGAMWCWLMYRRTPRLLAKPRKLVLFGTLAGAPAGVLATLLVNAGLIAVSGMWGLGAILAGVAAGAVIGSLIGLECALTWRKAVGRAGQRPPPTGPAAR